MSSYEKRKYKESLLSHEELKRLFFLDEENNCLRRKVKVSTKDKIGGKAGLLDKSTGYRRIVIHGVEYKEHRLIWFYVHGEWPEGKLDHKNQVKHDNNIKNLRPVTNSQNGINHQMYKNNLTGFNGVSLAGYYSDGTPKYQAFIRQDRYLHYLGTYKSLWQAYKARAKREFELFGEYSSISC